MKLKMIQLKFLKRLKISRLYRRLVNAFPNIKEKVQFKKWTLKEKLEDIKRQIKKEA